MTKPTLVVMAAGMGSRYGGLKQMDPVGPSGEIIIDYSVYDALQAGFGRVVFILAPAMEETFRQVAGDRMARHIPVSYVTQSLDQIPPGFALPAGRVKPLGTAHALYCCRHAVHEPFAVINADDFYGRDAFRQVAEFLQRPDGQDTAKACLIGYRIVNTLTENGTVARGVCQVTPAGLLSDIHECFEVGKTEKGITCALAKGAPSVTALPEDAVVSMNMWGFAPAFLMTLEAGLAAFLRDTPDLTSAEYYLPSAIETHLNAGTMEVAVLPTSCRWYGVTYKEDKQAVKAAIANMVEDGLYPSNLWG